MVVTRIWSSEDGCGNVARDTQVITVSNITAPILTGVPADTTLACGASLFAPPTVTAVDGCGNNIVAILNQIQNGSGCAYTVTRTWDCNRCLWISCYGNTDHLSI